jgi:stress response protein YsnF
MVAPGLVSRPMRNTNSTQSSLPLAEERLALRKRRVETGRVRIRTVLDEKTQLVQETLDSEVAEVERVPVGVEVDEVPQWRREGDVLVVPLVEEVLVVEKRLVLKEELRLRMRRSSKAYESKVKLRSTRAVVERKPAGGRKAGSARGKRVT